MDAFPLLSAMIVTAALFSWLNHRYIRLPTTIGVMLIALGMSLGLIALDLAGFHAEPRVEAWLEAIGFDEALLGWMLAFLLFAGALHVNLDDLYGQRWVIGILATVGVVVTTFLVGGLIWLVARGLGLEMPWIACLLFGALISPTDPIAVLGILRSARAPKSLETKITGESLFNDGIGVVVFTIVLGIAGAGAHGAGDHGAAADASSVMVLVGREVLGAIVLGFAAGWIAYRMLRSVDSYQVEVLITLALAMGVYSLAIALHSSGPIAVVVAGLLIGNTGRRYGMSESTREHLDTFWELVDEILNVVLFVLIGMEVLVVKASGATLAAGLLAIPLVLLARFLSVGGTVAALSRRRRFTPLAVPIMTWGGLRGGISVALALSLPRSIPARDAIVTMTYVVVVFSIVVQGLTIRRLVARIPEDATEAEPP